MTLQSIKPPDLKAGIELIEEYNMTKELFEEIVKQKASGVEEFVKVYVHTDSNVYKINASLLDLGLEDLISKRALKLIEKLKDLSISFSNSLSAL